MSLLRGNELRLRLSARQLQAGLWGGGWRLACVAQAEAESGPEACVQVLAALAAQGHELPRRATLCLEDDLLYFALLAADTPWRGMAAQARAHFAELLGPAELTVACTLLPCGRRWLAAAVPAALLAPLREALAQRGVALAGVRVALVEDLRHHARVLGDDGVVALLRDGGLMLAGLRGGSVAEVDWERCELEDAAALAARVNAFRCRFAVGLGSAEVQALPLQVLAGRHAAFGSALAAAAGGQLVAAPGLA